MSLNKLKKIQDDNGGYLPQDVVDLILNPDNTDNTKLGYWDGGSPLVDNSLIGYYPFSGDLKNKAPNAGKDDTAILINHPNSDGVYKPEEPATFVPEPVFVETDQMDKNGKPTGKTIVKGLNIADSVSKGAIQVASPSTEKFSISFDLEEITEP